MFRSVLLQAAATLLAAVLGGLLAGARGSLSAVVGGVVYLLPSLFFAWRIGSVSGSPRVGFMKGFMVNLLLGESIKLLVIIGSLFFVARTYPDLHWPSLLIGLVFTTQAMFLAFWKKS